MGGRAFPARRLALFSFIALLAVVLAAPLVSAAPPDVDIVIDRPNVTADMTLQRDQDVELSSLGNVTVDVDFSTSVYLSVEGGDLTAIITPDEKLVPPGQTIIPFEVLTTVPWDAAEGSHDVKVVVSGETPDGVPFIFNRHFNVRVIQNRLGLSAVQTEMDVSGPGDYTFEIKLENLGTSFDTFELTPQLPSDMAKAGFVLGLDHAILDVQPGAERFVHLTITVPENVTGAHSITLAASSSTDSRSSSSLTFTLNLPLPPPPPEEAAWYHQPLNLAIVSLGLVAVGSALFLAGTEIGLFALFSFLAPLYVRLKRDKVLSHFTRGQIFGYVKASPGSTYSEILRELELSNGVLTYHLKVLEREGFIKAAKDVVHKRFYPAGQKIEPRRFRPNRLQKDIIIEIERLPGITQAQIAKLLGESKQLINYHVKILERLGFLRGERSGREIYYYMASLTAGGEEMEPGGESTTEAHVVRTEV